MWGVAEKNKTKNTNCSSFCKKKTLIDVDCTQKKLMLVATWLSILGCNLVAKKTYGWLFSPHRMQTCLMCLSQARGRSLIQ
jgi:hypothetical protein